MKTEKKKNTHKHSRICVIDIINVQPYYVEMLLNLLNFCYLHADYDVNTSYLPIRKFVA